MTRLGAAQYLFSRIYQLDLQPPTPGPAVSFGNRQGEQSALRVAFNLQKKIVSAPNKGSIAVFNLNRDLRAAIGVGWRVSLQAGYDGLAERIFLGKIGTVNTQRQGADIVTSMECLEGFGALMLTPFNASYPPGTRALNVLQDIARVMNVDSGILRDIPNRVYTRGAHFSGSCRDVLDKILRPFNLEPSLQNGRLNILPQSQPLGTSAIVISERTGLIAAPSIDKKKVEFEALLNPRLVPGQLVQIETQNKAAAGFFKIRETKIDGDSHDAKWTVACTCARLTDVLLQPVLAQGFRYNLPAAGLI